MATEKVKYVYELVDDISAKLNKINKKLRENNGEFKKSGNSAIGFGKSLTSALPAIAGITAALFATKKALDFTVKSVFSFSGASAKLKAIVQPTTQEFKALEKAALNYGATTAFTASQVMDAYTEQAKLGQTVNEILASGSAVLDLAAMSQIGLAEAATISTQTLNQFSLEANQTNRVVDVMAKAFTSSALDANKFGEAMKYVGTVGAESGNSVEDVTAALGALADRAIDSSQAGTATRRVMLELADSNSKASKAIAATGQKADTFVEKLKVLKSLNLDLTDTTEMFGLLSSTAATVLISAADDVQTLSNSLQEADGSAKNMADTMLDSLPGAVTKMKSALEGLALTTKDVLAPALTAVINQITKLAQGARFLLDPAVKKQQEMNDAIVTEMQELKSLQKEYENIVAAQLAFKRHQGSAFNPDILEQYSNALDVVKQQMRELNQTAQGPTGSSGTKQESTGSSGTKKTTETITKAFEFKQPKVPVSYFDEMVQKYQQQAEFQYIAEERQKAKEQELHDQRLAWSAERTEAFITENERKKQAEEELNRMVKGAAIDGTRNIVNTVFAIKNRGYEREKKKQIENIKNSNKSEKEKQKAIEAIEKEAFEKNKKRSIAQAIINGALSITKVFATMGPPASFVMAALTAVTTATQIATIASQKFAKGGIVQKEPGKSLTGDQHLVRVNPGEMILNKDQQRTIGQNISIGGTSIVIQGSVDQDTLSQIDKTLEDRNEDLRQSLLELSESGRIGGINF